MPEHCHNRDPAERCRPLASASLNIYRRVPSDGCAAGRFARSKIAPAARQ